jgi:hypothetical protein
LDLNGVVAPVQDRFTSSHVWWQKLRTGETLAVILTLLALPARRFFTIERVVINEPLEANSRLNCLFHILALESGSAVHGSLWHQRVHHLRTILFLEAAKSS